MENDALNTGTGDAVKKFNRPKAFYDLWQEGEGIPVYKLFHVEDLNTVELGWWERFGAKAAFVNLADPFITTAIVLEIPPGKQTKKIRHLFETWVYVVSGMGETKIEQPGHKADVVRWSQRGLFGPPLNTRYQHRNLHRQKPARLLMVTNAPLTLNLYHNADFVWNNPYKFEDRYDGRQGYFNEGAEYLGGRVTRTNFIPDVLGFQLMKWKERGFGAKSFHMSMSDHTSAVHLSEFEVGTYKKAHRHGPGAHVVILQGTGYSLIWQEGEEPRRVDWREGSMFSPPEWYFHQHFNTGPEPARYLALRRGGSPEHPMKIGMSGGKSAPDQIEYEQEPRWIYDMYEAELKKNGVPVGQPRAEYRNIRDTILKPVG